MSDVDVAVAKDGKDSDRELNRTVGKEHSFRQPSNVAESIRLLPKCLAVHNRGRRGLDTISPGLRISIETARASVALAGPSPGETRAERRTGLFGTEGGYRLVSHVGFGRPVASAFRIGDRCCGSEQAEARHRKQPEIELSGRSYWE